MRFTKILCLGLLFAGWLLNFNTALAASRMSDAATLIANTPACKVYEMILKPGQQTLYRPEEPSMAVVLSHSVIQSRFDNGEGLTITYKAREILSRRDPHYLEPRLLTNVGDTTADFLIVVFKNA